MNNTVSHRLKFIVLLNNLTFYGDFMMVGFVENVGFQSGVKELRKSVITVDSCEGRLKMREWKMRYGQDCKGGKCRSGKSGSRSQGWKMQ